jgi:alkylation response protein AidB-like acyl-CoA dehydrogenase
LAISVIMLETAILKVFASESLWRILYDTMQLFGGRSFFTSEPFERLMRDARINMIGEGSNEVLRVFIAAVFCEESPSRGFRSSPAFSCLKPNA